MTKHKNQLKLYRRRMRLTQQQVVELLGKRVPRYHMSRFENGVQLPPLDVALGLEILYRVPIAFCYPEMYHGMRDHLRSAEEQMRAATSKVQAVLF